MRGFSFYRFRYGRYHAKTTAVKLGLMILLFLIFMVTIQLCVKIYAGEWYESILYRGNARGRWIRYRKDAPELLYLKVIDGLPVIHFIREHKDKTEPTPVFWPPLTGVPEQPITYGEKMPINYSYSGLQENSQNLPLSEFVRLENEKVQAVDTGKDILSTIVYAYDWKVPSEQIRFFEDYYIADPSVGNVSNLIPGKQLLTMNLRLKDKSEQPQILIYHTHGTEDYIDSRDGNEADTVVGMGDILCEELERLGFSVLHDRTTYDFIDGKNNHSYAYSTARPSILKTLEEYPSIEVILDVHRDSGTARTAVINGKRTAQIMLFNGLSRNADGPITYLENTNLHTNLAFSLQMNLLGRNRFPGLMFRIYLKNYRYNMHLCGKYLLVELGTEKNTVAEAENGARLLAEILAEGLAPEEGVD